MKGGIKQKKSIKILSIAVVSVILSQGFIAAQAANSYIPELNVYQKNSIPRVEIGVDMASEDIIDVVGFEDASQYDLNYRGNGNGNQSIISDDYYSNGKALLVENTKDTKLGNYYMKSVDTNSNQSCVTFNKTFKANNSQWVSMSYLVKSNSDSTIESAFLTSGIAYRPLSWVINGKTVIYNETVTWTKWLESFSVSFEDGSDLPEGSTCYVATSKNTDRKFSYNPYRYSKADKKMHCVHEDIIGKPIDDDKRSAYNKGDVLNLVASIFVNRSSRIRDDNQWHKYSANIKLISDITKFDYSRDGLISYLLTESGGGVKIDEVKFGYASRVQVMRDGTQVYDDYGSEFEDSDLSIKPNTPTISSFETYANSVRLTYSSDTKTEQHIYKARSKSSRGNWSNWSTDYPITLESIPDKYHLVLYKNGEKVVDKDTGTVFDYKDIKRGDRLTGQLCAIDKNGQKSQVVNIGYTVKQTLNDYKNDMKNLEIDGHYPYGEDNNIKEELENESIKLRTNSNLNNYRPRVEILDKLSETEFKEGIKEVRVYLDKVN